jgi:proteasome lid subunit RPN8/RPN11
MEKTVKVIIPQKVKEQILFLCSRIYEVEWSGILLYNTTGEIGEDLEITLEHIYLMNKGTTTYTEFETDESIVSFLMKNPQYFDCKKGLIHSHNSMNVFFSSTDLDELYSNAEFHNYYLSVIVNNKHEVCAKIAQKGTTVDVIDRLITFNSLTGNKVQKVQQTKENDIILVYPCEIVSTKFNDLDFIERTNEIIQKAELKIKTTVISTHNQKEFNFPKTFDYNDYYGFNNTSINSKVVEDDFILPDDTRNEEDFAAKWIAQDMDFAGTLADSLKMISGKFKGKNKAEQIDDYMDILEESFNVFYFQYFDDVKGESKDYTLMVLQFLLTQYYDKYEIASEVDTICSLLITYYGK